MLRAKPEPVTGDVRLALHTDVEAEREWVAERIAAEYAAARESEAPPPTAAVLVRRNADAAPIAEALRARGLPVEVVGLGGLLHTPRGRGRDRHAAAGRGPDGRQRGRAGVDRGPLAARRRRPAGALATGR